MAPSNRSSPERRQPRGAHRSQGYRDGGGYEALRQGARDGARRRSSRRSRSRACAAAAAPASPPASSGASSPRATTSRSTWSATPTSPSPAPSRTGCSWSTTRTSSSRAAPSAAGRCGANTCYIYIRGEYTKAAGDPRAGASSEAYDGGHPRRRASWARGFELDMYVHRGAGAYICGEETGLLESLEGKRGQPRVKPPFPAVVGAFGGPTVINNVETLCNVPHIVERGADWFKAIGTDERNTGPKLYAISGPRRAPGHLRATRSASPSASCSTAAGGMYKRRRRSRRSSRAAPRRRS